ncbi:Uncharacterized protein QTN25_007694 [Entamoeba marina]
MSIQELIHQNNITLLSKFTKKEIQETTSTSVSLQIIAGIYGNKLVTENNLCLDYRLQRRISLRNGNGLIEKKPKKFDQTENKIHRKRLFEGIRNMNKYLITTQGMESEKIIIEEGIVVEFQLLFGMNFNIEIHSDSISTISSNGTIEGNSFYKSNVFQHLKQYDTIGLVITKTDLTIYLNGEICHKLMVYDNSISLKLTTGTTCIIIINDGIDPFIYDYNIKAPFKYQVLQDIEENLPLAYYSFLPEKKESDCVSCIHGNQMNIMRSNLTTNKIHLNQERIQMLLAACGKGNYEIISTLNEDMTVNEKTKINEKDLIKCIRIILLGDITPTTIKILSIVLNFKKHQSIVDELKLIAKTNNFVYLQQCNDLVHALNFSLKFPWLGTLLLSIEFNCLEIFSAICCSYEVSIMTKQSTQQILSAITSNSTIEFFNEFKKSTKGRFFDQCTISITSRSNMEVIKAAFQSHCQTGKTLFDAANTNFELFKMLLEFDLSQITSVDKLGNSFLHIAAMKSFTLLAKYLLQHGIQKNTLNNSNLTPFDLLHQNADMDLFDLLKPDILSFVEVSTINNWSWISFKNTIYGFNVKDTALDIVQLINNEITTPITLKLTEPIESITQLLTTQQYIYIFGLDSSKQLKIIQYGLNTSPIIIPISNILITTFNCSIYNDQIIFYSFTPNQLNTIKLYTSKFQKNIEFQPISTSILPHKLDTILCLNTILIGVNISEEYIESNQVIKRNRIFNEPEHLIYIYDGKWHEKLISMKPIFDQKPILHILLNGCFIYIIRKDQKHLQIDLFSQELTFIQFHYDVINSISIVNNLLMINDKLFQSPPIPTLTQMIYYHLSFGYDTQSFIIYCNTIPVYYQLFLLKRIPYFKELIERGITEIHLTTTPYMIRNILSVAFTGLLYYSDQYLYYLHCPLIFQMIKDKYDISSSIEPNQIPNYLICSYDTWKSRIPIQSNDTDCIVSINNTSYPCYRALLSFLFPSFTTLFYNNDNIHVTDPLLVTMIPILFDVDNTKWLDYFIALLRDEILGSDSIN